MTRPAASIVYVSCAESREIQVFALDAESGRLSPRQQLTMSAAPLPLKVSPDRRVLFAGTRAENALVAFAIDAQRGTLSRIGDAAAAGRPAYVACDRAMRLAFSASYGENQLEVFPLDAQGVPQPASQIEGGLPHAHAALADHQNRWLLVPLLGADAIAVYRITADGLTPHQPPRVDVRAGSGPRHPLLSADNQHLYCLNELDGTIDHFAFDADNGRLTARESVAVLPPGYTGKPWCAELRATPDGRFLYASDRRSSVLAAFAVERESGSLCLIDRYPTETQPRGMDVSPCGRWLVAAGELSGCLTVYAIDPTSGRLTPRQREVTGKDPICVEIVGLTCSAVG